MKYLLLIARAWPNRTLLVCLPVLLLAPAALADEPCCQSDSWIFRRSQYSHDPESGARVAQYAMKPIIEPLPDVRQVTSGYSRSRTVLRGADGSTDTTYRVQSYGNGRGGMDAQWERFHDAWRGATIGGGRFYSGGYGGYGPYGGYGGYGGAYNGYGGAYGGYGGGGGYGVDPGFGMGPAYGHGGDGLRHQNYPPPGFDRPRFRGPDARRLDPDAADGFPSRDRHQSNREFFWQPRAPHPHPYPPTDGKPTGGSEGSGTRP